MCGSSKCFGSWICTVDTVVFLEVHWLSCLPRGRQGKERKTLGFHCLPRFGLLWLSLVGMWHGKNEVFVCRPTVTSVQVEVRGRGRSQFSSFMWVPGSTQTVRIGGKCLYCWTISHTPYLLLLKNFYPSPLLKFSFPTSLLTELQGTLEFRAGSLPAHLTTMGTT